MSIYMNVFDQGQVITMNGYKLNGVCLELCRRWVKAQLTGQWREYDTIQAYEQKDTFDDIVACQRKRGKMGDIDIDNFLTSSSKRSNGFFKYKGLRSRKDVIAKVTGAPGCYIYMATEKGKGGHAFAFDSRRLADASFFDPNQGEWRFKNENAGSIGDWWDKWWEAKGGDGKIDYKKHFHQGERALVCYTIPPD